MIRLLALLLLIPTLASAQIEITWGIPQKAPKNSITSKIIGVNQRYIYSIRNNIATFRSNDPILECISRVDKIRVFLKAVRHTYKDSITIYPEAQYLIGNMIIAIASRFDRKTGITTLYVETLDQDANVISSWRKIGSYGPERIQSTNVDEHGRGQFHFNIAFDSTFISILYVPSYVLIENGSIKYEPSNRCQIDILRVDDLSLTTHELQLPFPNEYYDVEDIKLDKSGDIYMHFWISSDPKVTNRYERRMSDGYRNSLLIYNVSTDSLTEYKIPSDHGAIPSLNYFRHKDLITCVGFYKNINSRDIAGLYTCTFNATNRTVIYEEKFDLANQNLIQSVILGSEWRTRQYYELSIKTQAWDGDSSIIFIAEQVARYDESIAIRMDQYSPATQSMTMNYTGLQEERRHISNCDLIIASIGPSGKIEYVEKIMKPQIVNFPMASSYLLLNGRDKLYFVFNDDRANVKLGAKTFTHTSKAKNLVPVVVAVNRQGIIERMELNAGKNFPKYFLPCINFSFNGATIVYGGSNNTYQFGELKFN